MKHFNTILLTLILIVLVSGLTTALEYDHIISNSEQWQDVYSVIQFGELHGVSNNFLTSTRHSNILLYSVPLSKENILVVSSSQNPYVIGYTSIIESKGYDQAIEERFRNVNLGLAEMLEDINNFIIVDDAYGYNAIAVAPYAIVSESYVLFANQNNINQIINFLSNTEINNLLIYGHVHRNVRNRLLEFNPEIIDTGDRFDNNIEIVKKYQELKPTKQVILSNGEFIEQSLMTGNDPVLFIGKASVPTQIREYVQTSDFEVGILVGNELIGTATFVKRQIGISVFVKFAQGARVPTGSISAVEDLDRFYLPRYILSLGIHSINYNSATKQLEVNFINNVNLGTYLKSTITLRSGDETVVVGDEIAEFIEGNEIKTFVYDNVEISEEDLTAEIYTLFGESIKALENVLEATVEVSSVRIVDNSQIEIVEVKFDKSSGTFIVTIENTGDVSTYVYGELIDFLFDNQYLIFGSDERIFLEAGKKGKLRIRIEDYDEETLLDNEKIILKFYYGERENSLVKTLKGEFNYTFTTPDFVFYGLLLILIILILLIATSKKKCKHCDTKNPRRNKYCKSCGKKLD